MARVFLNPEASDLRANRLRRPDVLRSFCFQTASKAPRPSQASLYT